MKPHRGIKLRNLRGGRCLRAAEICRIRGGEARNVRPAFTLGRQLRPLSTTTGQSSAARNREILEQAMYGK